MAIAFPSASTSARVCWKRHEETNLHHLYCFHFTSTEWCRRRSEGGGIRCEGEDKQSFRSLSTSHGEGVEARNKKRAQLWHEFFADPSQWRDNRPTKKSAKQPDFKHKCTLEALWIDCWWNPSWVKEKLTTLDSSAHKKQKNPCCNDGESEMAQELCKEGRLNDAIHLVECMMQQASNENVPKATYMYLLKECTKRKKLIEGKRVHALIVQSNRGFHLDIVLQNTLVRMYAKCGCLGNARDLFNKMSKRDVVSWNAMIAGCAQNGLGMEAIALYKQMKEEGMEADSVTFVCVLKACASIGALEQGKQIHSLILEKGFHLDITVQNTLVDMYSKCECLDDARDLFDKMSKRDVVSWNAMISGYAQNGLGIEAIALYKKMKQEGVEADSVTFVCALKACVSIGALEEGRQIHSLILEKGFHLDVVLQSTLVDMYAKCGCLDNARDVFNKMSKRDVVSWSAMIAGYAQNGRGMEAIALYEQMKKEGIELNDVAYTCVLSACSHSGLVKEGFHVFDFLCTYSGVIPTQEHYACMVNLLGRAGLLVEAKDFISKMPIRPDKVVWMTLLGAARNVGNVDIGQHAFYNVMKLDPQNAAPYLLLIDIFARVGQVDKVAKVKKVMMDRGLKKMPGCSWIEVNNQVHTFIVGDESHPQSQQIWTQLTTLLSSMRRAGYVPDLNSVLEDVSEKEKEISLCKHSVKLAIGFGLISMPSWVPIRIKKNLLVCRDCHNATKIISKITGQEIFVIDAKRLHQFKDGLCSCRDYW